MNSSARRRYVSRSSVAHVSPPWAAVGTTAAATPGAVPPTLPAATARRAGRWRAGLTGGQSRRLAGALAATRYTGRPCRPRPGDIVELDIDTLAYGGQGVARARRLRRLRARRRARRPRARPGHASASEPRRGAAARDPHPLPAPRRRRAAPTPRTAAAASGRRSPTRRSSSSSSAGRRVAAAHRRTSTASSSSPSAAWTTPGATATRWSSRSAGRRTASCVLGLHRRGSWREIVEIRTASSRRSA